jgi:hypothetical protein
MTRTFFVSAAGVNLDACGLRVTVSLPQTGRQCAVLQRQLCVDASFAPSCEHYEFTRKSPESATRGDAGGRQRLSGVMNSF